jgi:hypothetical protein
MAVMAEPQRQNTISAGDWQGEQLSAKASANNDFSTVREQGLSTGVRVKGMYYPRVTCGILAHKQE